MRTSEGKCILVNVGEYKCRRVRASEGKCILVNVGECR